MSALIKKYKFYIIAVVIILIIVSGTAATFALWEEKLDAQEDITNTTDVWNESEKYIDFAPILEGEAVVGYAVSGYDGLIDAVEIPRSHLGKPVVAIKSSFVNNNLIKEIIIPDTVIIIESNAFLNFTRLNKVTIRGGEKTLTIGEYAFMNCNSLTSLSIDSNRLLYIADTAFYNTAGVVKPTAS